MPAGNAIELDLGAAGVVTAATTTSLTVTMTAQPNATGVLTAVVIADGVSSGAPVQVATVVPAPTVTATSFRLAQSASLLTINGANFDPTAAGNTILFDVGSSSCGRDCPVGVVTAATTTQLHVALSIPQNARGPLTALVTSHGGSSGAMMLVAYLVDPPAVTEASVIRAINAPTLTIRGTGFEPLPNAARNTVKLSLGAVGVVTAAHRDTITGAYELTVALSKQPTSKGILTAVVKSFFGSSGAPVQVAKVVDAPTVTESKQEIKWGSEISTIIISGTGFDPTADGNNVVLNSGAVGNSVTAATTTSLTVKLESKPPKGPLMAIVTAFGGSSGAPVQVAEATSKHAEAAPAA